MFDGIPNGQVKAQNQNEFQRPGRSLLVQGVEALGTARNELAVDLHSLPEKDAYK